MKIKLLQRCVGPLGTFPVNSVQEIPEVTARCWIDDGVAIPVGASRIDRPTGASVTPPEPEAKTPENEGEESEESGNVATEETPPEPEAKPKRRRK